ETPSLDETEGLPTELLSAVEAAAGETELGAVVALAAITERDSFADTSVEPLTGARVELESTAALVQLCEQGQGTYTVSTLPEETCDGAGLAYAVGSKYVTAIETATERYTLTIDAAPAPVANVTFSPAFGTSNALGVPTHAGGSPLTVDWSQNPGELDGFVTLFRIDYAGSPSDPLDALDAGNWSAAPSNPVFDNFPRDAGDALDFAIGDPVTTVTVPAGALAEPGLYLVLVTAVQLSDDVSSNLSLGSYMIAGAGRSWAFWVE
ncbi:MAG: hypothetical protein AAFX94_08140, partial [Myxococcota bacterium]